MSGGPRVRSLNIAEADAEAEAEARPVLVPGGNKARLEPTAPRKPAAKPLRKATDKTEIPPMSEGSKKAADGLMLLASPHKTMVATRKHGLLLLHSNSSLNASCSSNASTDSFASRASTGKIGRQALKSRPKQSLMKREKAAANVDKIVLHSAPVPGPELVEGKRKCAWVTSNTDPCYAAFHDEEWGLPVHDDKRLFELLVLSGALAERTWPEILSKRHMFREVFMDFDPAAMSKLNEKKIVAPENIASSLLSASKLRAIIENAHQILKIIQEFGSFDKYCWSFVSGKPIIGRFRYPYRVPVKSPKADAISKDMVRRGFRSVGPTVIYSFMQAAGLTNDHLITCFRFEQCVAAASPDTDEDHRSNIRVDIKMEETESIHKEDLSKSVNALDIS